MKKLLSPDLWLFKEAKTPSALDRFVLLVLIIIGTLSMLNLADWWFTEVHIVNHFLFILLSLFFWYQMFRTLLNWINYINIKKPLETPIPEENLLVAVFTTSAPGEPISMFENTFKALKNLNYAHTTYLLDSTQDEEFRKLAEKYDVVFLDLANLPGAKAGKVNEALRRTTEDFILILDPDHIVFPNFLDQTLGFFRDQEVGFVQVSQGYYNQYRSFVAHGAAEQTYMFYGPTQMGLNGNNAAVAIGANCTFRRKALESIGGHAQGLAEDLQTSLRIHAKGWKSIYNPVIVSRGIVPEDLGSFCKQQLKWARGVFEVLFEELPQQAKNYSFWQKLSYFSTGTFYLVGPITLFFILIPLLYFGFGLLPGNMIFSDFLIKAFPIAIVATCIYAYTQKFLCDPSMEKGFHWRGMILKYVCWPAYTYAFYLAIRNKKIPYIPTAKRAQTAFLTPFTIPFLIYCICFLVGLVAIFINRRFFMEESTVLLSSYKTWGMIGFSFLASIQSIAGLMAAYEAVNLKPDDPWGRVKIKEDKTIMIN